MQHVIGDKINHDGNVYKVEREIYLQHCGGCAFSDASSKCPLFTTGCSNSGVIFVLDPDGIPIGDDPIIGRTIKSYDYVGGDMKITFTDGTEQLIQSGNDRDYDAKCMLEKDWDNG